MREPSAARHPDASRYEIRVEGHLDDRWATWFDCRCLLNENDGTALIRGEGADQAALHGLLQNVRDLGLPLISVNQLQPAMTHSPNAPRGTPVDSPRRSP